MLDQAHERDLAEGEQVVGGELAGSADGEDHLLGQLGCGAASPAVLGATALAGDDQYRKPDLVRQQLAARKLQGRNAMEAYSRTAIALS